MSRKAPVLVTVYDLDNKPHQMAHLNARDMITHRGWSMVPVDKKAVASGEKLLSEALAKATDSNVDLKAIQKELDGKTKAEMVALALERYGEKLDGRSAEQVIITTILELETEAQRAGKNTPDEPDQPDENDGAETSSEEGNDATSTDDGETDEE